MFHKNVNPGVQYSSVFQWLAEHTGDLIHRASYPPKGTVMGGPITYGFDAVKEKVEKIFRTATDFNNHHRRTGENPFLNSLENDYKFGVKEGKISMPFEEYKNQFINAGKKYSQSYRLLSYYTELQSLSRLAAIFLGKLDIQGYYLALSRIKDLIKDGPKSYFTPSVISDNQDENVKRCLLALQKKVEENDNKFIWTM